MGDKIAINNKPIIRSIFGWLFSIIVLTIGVLNIFLVHPVPGIAYLLISLIYLPPANAYIKTRFGFMIPPVVKIALGIVLIMFTFGVSDLGDMIDKL